MKDEEKVENNEEISLLTRKFNRFLKNKQNGRKER